MTEYEHANINECSVPPYDPISRKHYWAVHVVYHIADPEQAVMDDSYVLDSMSRVAIVGPTCVYCNHEYSLNLSVSKCKGAPYGRLQEV
jgi:hypothetical protein